MAIDAWPVGLPNYDTRGYRMELEDNLLRTKMDSGRSRVRRTSTFTSTMLSCAWVLDATQLRIFRDFYHASLADGTEPFTLPVYAGSAGANKAKNADMEVVPAGGGVTLGDWLGNPGALTVTRSSSEKVTGGYSLKVENTTGSTGLNRLIQQIYTTTGTHVATDGLVIAKDSPIYCSGWVKVTNGIGTTCQLIPYEVDGAVANASVGTTTVVSNGEWQYLASSGIIAQSDRLRFQVYIGMTGAAPDGAIVYVDDVYLGNTPESGFHDQQARFAEPYRITYRTADTWAVAARLEVLDNIVNT